MKSTENPLSHFVLSTIRQHTCPNAIKKAKDSWRNWVCAKYPKADSASTEALLILTEQMHKAIYAELKIADLDESTVEAFFQENPRIWDQIEQRTQSLLACLERTIKLINE